VLVGPLEVACESLRANLDLYVGHHTSKVKYEPWGEERDAPHRVVKQMSGQRQNF